MILSPSQADTLAQAIRANDPVLFSQTLRAATGGQPAVEPILGLWKLAVDLDRPTMQEDLGRQANGTAKAEMWLHLVNTGRRSLPLTTALGKIATAENLLDVGIVHDQPALLAELVATPRIRRRALALDQALAKALREDRRACAEVLLPVSTLRVDAMGVMADQPPDIWARIFPSLRTACLRRLVSTLGARAARGDQVARTRLDSCFQVLPADALEEAWLSVAQSAIEAPCLPLLADAFQHLDRTRHAFALVHQAQLIAGSDQPALNWLLPRVDLEAVRLQYLAFRPRRWGFMDSLVSRLPPEVADHWMAQHGAHLPQGTAWQRDRQAQRSAPPPRRPRVRS